MSKMKIVHVRWADPAFANNGWKTIQEFNDWVGESSPVSETVGLLTRETKQFVVVSQSVGGRCVAGSIQITRRAILSIRTIGQVKVDVELS